MVLDECPECGGEVANEACEVCGAVSPVVEHGDLWVDYEIEWRVGEPVRWHGRRGVIFAGGTEPFRVLVKVEGNVFSARLDELEAIG